MFWNCLFGRWRACLRNGMSHLRWDGQASQKQDHDHRRHFHESHSLSSCLLSTLQVKFHACGAGLRMRSTG
ncbi:hypothetical protein NSPZN2_80017 [Nitrospira defluvii]|uniref:Uncharacterized protein n=1 Tax=Nitrospira defluvii TaxID=330214 RepID=A0ABM8SC09_9BACT|nr:hypothetical protein NSPZN2_80017 [Nitrospira defluvii]